MKLRREVNHIKNAKVDIFRLSEDNGKWRIFFNKINRINATNCMILIDNGRKKNRKQEDARKSYFIMGTTIF